MLGNILPLILINIKFTQKRTITSFKEIKHSTKLPICWYLRSAYFNSKDTLLNLNNTHKQEGKEYICFSYMINSRKKTH